MNDPNRLGHRQRLRDRFLTEANGARSDAALLELLLTYAIPQQDVQPLVQQLIARFGDLSNVLSASAHELCQINGIKLSTATLLKLVDWIRSRHTSEPGLASPAVSEPSYSVMTVMQPLLFTTEEPEPPQTIPPQENTLIPPQRREMIQRPRTGLFGKAVLEEAVEQLPQLPDTESLEEIGRFLRTNLHFSAEETRHRYSNYIIRRMFPDGYADWSMRAFARRYAGGQELRDVCFYRFCKAEPLMFEVAQDVLMPALMNGTLDRARLRDYLDQRFPGSKSVNDCSQAIVQAWVTAGFARADRQVVVFSYRDVPVASFAFILHSEFGEPNMYDIAKVETNAAIRALLWNPERIVPALYDLRNMDILSKVSQIDAFRQFTTKGGLAETVRALVREEGNA